MQSVAYTDGELVAFYLRKWVKVYEGVFPGGFHWIESGSKKKTKPISNEVSCLWEFCLIKNKNLHPLQRKKQQIIYLVITDGIRLFPGKVSIVNFHTFHVL